jgi:diamine N-acetyltransferase
MVPFTIKKATLSDLSRLQEIGRQTFSETFASENKKEDMERYLAESFSIERLEVELKDPNAEFYFATMEEKIIGYLKLNFGPSQTDLKDEKAVEIERIYVLKEYHGKKVGQLLYEQAIQIARQKKADYVWLGV